MEYIDAYQAGQDLFRVVSFALATERFQGLGLSLYVIGELLIEDACLVGRMMPLEVFEQIVFAMTSDGPRVERHSIIGEINRLDSFLLT
jgi:hypothetical protein